MVALCEVFCVQEGSLMPWVVPGPRLAFHITAEVRRLLGVEESWVTLRGGVLLVDVGRAELLAGRWRLLAPEAQPRLRASDLYAGALLEQIFRLLIAHHLEHVDPTAMRVAEERARRALGADFDQTLEAFVARYPPPDVARGAPARVALRRVVDGVSGVQVAIEEAWMCFLANANPALRALKPWVDVAPLSERTRFDVLIRALQSHFDEGPSASFAPESSLFRAMLEPIERHPESMAGQLRFVREQWGAQLGERFEGLLDSLHEALVMVAEEDEFVVRRDTLGVGRPSFEGFADALLAGQSGGDAAPMERFSPDSAWMPQVVMVAKSTYVWLDQLSAASGRQVQRLDEVPDAALDELAELGFNALWLIGVWRRSRASREIKILRGQRDALASAYALDDYVIAEELGGEPAFAALRERALQRGIRLATDMVPNHVGIDGRWVREHPERLISVPTPPYPNYRFEGPDLSPDPTIELRIEQGYFDGSDAAVVFERIDRQSGERRYVYHGNDGTLMPWNDTAQLDYARADVREAVIETILEVARRAPIVRFDAAMTLAKRHIRRLWYPPVGEEGGVPSRGRTGSMTEADFEAAMPQEFWREVVDRIAVEAPDTLLLAEAFWMLEGYFVRTLGMHRVYNSAFMHMLRDQNNSGYRSLMREVLAFDARVLQRYVNFMNNPDEESAREQFGEGDRFFAVSTLLATLPGLPMFGHGQVEGLREKYGMEYQRAKRDEKPDPHLLARHAREIAPLLRRRWQFADVDGFRLFDAVDLEGALVEDVYAYANVVSGARSWVLVNHRYERAAGWLKRSVPMVLGLDEAPVVDSLAAALGLEGGPKRFLVGRDAVSGRTFVRPSDELIDLGWSFELEGYQVLVLLDIEERFDHDGTLAALVAAGAQSGLAGFEQRRHELLASPWREALRAWLAGAVAAARGAALGTSSGGAAVEPASLLPPPLAWRLEAAPEALQVAWWLAYALRLPAGLAAVQHLLERPDVDLELDGIRPLLSEHLHEDPAPWSRAVLAYVALQDAAASRTKGDRLEQPDVERLLSEPLGVHSYQGVMYAEGAVVDALLGLLTLGEAQSWCQRAAEGSYRWPLVVELLGAALLAPSDVSIDAPAGEVGEREG